MRQSCWPRVPMAEHREPCESRGLRTVLGAPGGEIPPGDSTIADNTIAPAFVRFRTRADKVGLWPRMTCPLMTHQRHWLCTAAIVLMPVSAPIKVLV
jgi:hypothetical protein